MASQSVWATLPIEAEDTVPRHSHTTDVATRSLDVGMIPTCLSELSVRSGLVLGPASRDVYQSDRVVQPSKADIVKER